MMQGAYAHATNKKTTNFKLTINALVTAPTKSPDFRALPSAWRALGTS
jgi:hypothetical protein